MNPNIVPITCQYPGASVRAYYVAAERPTLIDTGGSAHPEREIAAALAANGSDLGQIQIIVNTHGHWDHAGGNAAVQAACGAETWVHALGARYLASATPHLDGYAGDQARLLFPVSLQGLSAGSFADFLLPSAPPARLIADGDRLDLGGVVLTALHIPGHSEDLLAFYWEAEGILISGDGAQGTGSRPGGCPLYFGSVAQARASIRQLMEIPFRQLHVSHPFGRLGTEERTTRYAATDGRAFLADSLTVLDLMEGALRRTLHKYPDAPVPETVRHAVADLRRSDAWALLEDPALGVPPGAAVTFDRLRQALT